MIVGHDTHWGSTLFKTLQLWLPVSVWTLPPTITPSRTTAAGFDSAASLPPNTNKDEPSVPGNQEHGLVSMYVGAFRGISRH